MQDDAHQPQGLGAVDLVAHRLHRLLEESAVRRCQVDQIAGVGDHDAQTSGLHRRAELVNFLARKDAPAPLARVLREDLQRVATMDDCALDGARQPTSDRHVCTDQGQGWLLVDGRLKDRVFPQQYARRGRAGRSP
jgi:hypothetical protein